MERVNGMEELQLISRQHPGEVSIDNFFEMEVALTHALARYENVVYTEDMLADAKADKKEPPVCARNSTTGGKKSKKAYLAARDLRSIQTAGGEHTSALLAKYLERLELEDAHRA